MATLGSSLGSAQGWNPEFRAQALNPIFARNKQVQAAPRIRSENPVLVRRSDDEAMGAFGKTRVVGLGGCLFVSDEVFDLGALPGMAISVQGRTIQIVARVAHVRAQGTRFGVGVEFLVVDPAECNVIEHLSDGSSC